MSMQKRELWSLNRLSTELGHDRRTLAKRLAETPPDGERSGKPVWFLETALGALADAAPAGTSTFTALDHFADRLENWREPREPVDLPFAEAAAHFGLKPSVLLTWLRAGLPFVTAGDLEDGRGFVLRLHWLFDWMVLTNVVDAARPGTNAARLLRIQA